MVDQVVEAEGFENFDVGLAVASVQEKTFRFRLHPVLKLIQKLKDTKKHSQYNSNVQIVTEDFFKNF